ncbi:hypothetical protein Tco_0438665 [Tanacetum coccineum]
MSLSSTLIATISLLIIIVVVAVVVVSICRSASTILGQMANPLAVTALRSGLCSASYFVVVVDSDYFGNGHFIALAWSLALSYDVSMDHVGQSSTYLSILSNSSGNIPNNSSA